jgi:CubicO group peptidase (beta-lactamase class C family)
VEKYFPEVNRIQGRHPNAPPITLLQLATHTSGLDREPGDVQVYTAGPVSYWTETMKAALPHTRYLFEPGLRYSYSNIAYSMLGEALARAAGTPYIEYMTRNILEPLGMRQSAFEQNGAILGNLAKGYNVGSPGATADPSFPAKELRDGRGYKVPNGALFTTVSDLARFLSFELGHGPEAVLPRKVWIDNLTRSQSSNGELTTGYGVGFSMMRRGNMILFGHGGAVAGYHAGAYFHPPSQTGLIFLRNASVPDFRNDFVFSAFEALTEANQ